LANSNSNYIMTPKLVAVGQAIGVSAFSDSKLSITIEWNMVGRSGEPVWIETVTGIGIGVGGNAFTAEKHQAERVNKALNDLFHKSQLEMLSSKVLRNLQ
jgi:hypothetical protein